jgi:Calcineurin-like phosphoesterase
VIDWALKMRPRTCLTWSALAFLLAAFPASPQTPQDVFEGIHRVVAIGDIHGDYPRFLEVLRTAELIDSKGAWTGGAAHLVLVGDFVDRGDASAKVLDLIIALEPQARKAGGQVHALIGNHEAMDLYGDLRYVTKQDYASFQGPNSKELRERQMQAALDDLKQKGSAPPNESAWRKTFEEEHPLGWVEHRLAFQPDGKYGQWLRQQNAMLKINDAIFVHGGISQKYSTVTMREINDRVRLELADFKRLDGGMVTDDDGPLWYRGMAQLPEADEGMNALLGRVMALHQVRHIVIGHTPMVAVMPRFGGKVIAIDVGLSKPFGGPPAFLTIEDGKYYAMHRGRKLDLPVDGGSVLEYLGSAAALEPANSKLRQAVGKARP